MEQGLNLQSKRKKYIRELAKAENASKRAKAMAEDLFALNPLFIMHWLFRK